MIETKTYIKEDPRMITNIGELDLSWGKTKIFIYDYDEKIPHVHLKAESKECCICLYEPAYYGHKESYRNELTDNDCRMLNEFFKSVDSDLGKVTWNICTTLWNVGLHGKYEHKEEFMQNKEKQPNYTIISYDRYTRRNKNE